MKFRCPECRREYDIEDMLMDKDLLACIMMLNSFAPHANLVAAYTEMFGIIPLKNKRRKWRLLLEEMKRLFDTGAYEYNRRRYEISRAGMVEALNLVVHKHFTDHLENHNYLKKCMIGISEREARDTGRNAEKDLRRREERLQAGQREDAAQTRRGGDEPDRENGQDTERQTLSPEERARNQERVRNILNGIG